MAHTIIERPAQYCMSRNELRYVLKVTNPNRSGLYLYIKLYYHASTALVATAEPFAFKLKPNSDGTVYLYIKQHIDSVLSYVMPTGSAVLTNASAQTCKFYVHSQEIDDSSTGSLHTTEELHKRIAFKMGVENNRFSRSNALDYFIANKLFFTWQPNNRLVYDNQPLFLTLPVLAGTTNHLAVLISYKTVQGTTNGVAIYLPAVDGYLFHLKVDPVTLGLTIPAGEQLYYWDIYIANTLAFTTLINPFRFYREFKPLYTFYDFIYTNSVGGIDSARASGEVTVSVSKVQEDAEGGYSLTESSDIVKTARQKQVNIEIQKKYKGDLGFQNSKMTANRFFDLLCSPKIYTLIDSRWVPILNIQSSSDLYKTTDTKWSFPIEWQLAETNDVYTPEDIVLGISADTESYKGAIELTINSLTCNLHYLQGIAGFDLPNIYNNTHVDSPVVGEHSAALIANDISFFATVVGTSTTAKLLVNGILIDTITLPNESYLFFTSSFSIAKADIIEIIID